MRVLGYAYEASIHCPDCTSEAALANRFRREPPLCTTSDEHGLTLDMRDREGNPLRPVFSTDEREHPERCDDCGTLLGT